MLGAISYRGSALSASLNPGSASILFVAFLIGAWLQVRRLRTKQPGLV